MLQIKALSNDPFLLSMASPPSVPIPLKDFLYKKLSVSKKKNKGDHFRKGIVGEGSEVNFWSVG